MNIKTPLISMFALSVGISTVGCNAEDVDSEAIRTEGMYAKFEAVASGDGTTRVRAELRVGGDDSGATYIKLTGEDELVASADENSDGEQVLKGMDHDGSGDRHWYLERYQTDKDNTEFTISFNRGEDNDSAPDSVVAIPKPFTMAVMDLDEGDDLARGQDIEITWDNEDGGDINWEVEGSCIWNRDGVTADDMALVLPADEIEATGTGEGDDCTVTVTLERVRAGEVDDAFGEGGVFKGIQRRSFEFNSTPAPGEGEDSTGAGGAQ